MQQTPLAVFTCRTNSHPFQERQISVHEPIKIGRSVARVKASQNNAIFDCRVLSRNHALLWYENNKVSSMCIHVVCDSYVCDGNGATIPLLNTFVYCSFILRIQIVLMELLSMIIMLGAGKSSRNRNVAY